ncbi:MAG: integron [Mesorhizobium sp.]
MSRSCRALLLAGVIGLSAVPLRAEPVMVGGDETVDACPSAGEVRGLNPKGDNFLAVRNGPGPSHRLLDKIQTGQAVYLCDERRGWYGIVYGGEGCGVTSPVLWREAYAGPCRSGWVSARFIRVTAG